MQKGVDEHDNTMKNKNEKEGLKRLKTRKKNPKNFFFR